MIKSFLAKILEISRYKNYIMHEKLVLKLEKIVLLIQKFGSVQN